MSVFVPHENVTPNDKRRDMKQLRERAGKNAGRSAKIRALLKKADKKLEADRRGVDLAWSNMVQ